MNSSNTNQGFVWGHEICDFHIRGKGWKGMFITGAMSTMTTMTTMTIPMDVEEMVQALLEAQEGDPERPLMVLVEEAPWPHGLSRQWWMWIVAHNLEDPLCKNPGKMVHTSCKFYGCYGVVKPLCRLPKII